MTTNAFWSNAKPQKGIPVSDKVGIWIDHAHAVIVSAAAGGVTSRTVRSDVGQHPHYSGGQDGGGEKKYEARHAQRLDRFFDEVIGQVGQPEALLIFGPGEAKLGLEARVNGSTALAASRMAIEAADTLTVPQIIAKVKAHYGIAS